jgi:hypothetical protein
MPFLAKPCAWSVHFFRQGSRFAPINANPAALTARTAGAFPRHEGHLFLLSRSAAHRRKQKPQIQKGVISQMKTATKGPLFPFGQIVATPGEFLARNGSGENSTNTTARKINSVSNMVSEFSASIAHWRTLGFGSSPKPIAPSPRFFFLKSIE